MYIRRMARKNKGGSIAAYIQLAHNIRDPRSGVSKAQVLYHFGREDRLDGEALRRLDKDSRHFVQLLTGEAREQ